MAIKNNIIQSQILFGNFLNANIINTLVHLFDMNKDKYTNENKKIIKYVENERKLQGLTNLNVTINSEVYGYSKNKSTLFLIIKKNGEDFIHLSIHLSIKFIISDSAGVIHFYKDILDKNKTFPPNKKLYAPISIKESINNPNSLEFSIADGYTTLGINDASIYDSDLQKEMDAIINILNRLFDEDNDNYYVGTKKNINPIHNTTNLVLENINRHTKFVKRKNIGVKLNPLQGSNLSMQKKLKKRNKTRNSNYYKNKSLNSKTLKNKLNILSSKYNLVYDKEAKI